MLLTRENFRQHVPWIVSTVVVTVFATVWFVAAGFGKPGWPGGSSWPGFTFGVLGGAICLFELLLWWRKKVRTWRIGTAKAWMRAHIWLGLLSVPLLVLHSGFVFSNTLGNVLMVLFLVVIASGIWGLVFQQFLPKRMLNDIPAETIYSQIDHVVGMLGAEAERLVVATCGPQAGDDKQHAFIGDEDVAAVPAGHMTVGAVRTAGGVQGKVLQTRMPAKPVPGSEALLEFFERVIVPYLRKGSASGSPLQVPARASVMFADLRTKLDPRAHDAVLTLENLCNQRRQLDHQARLHFWLHSWLCVHLPLSVALIVLMFVHIWVTLKFWS